MQPTNNSPLLSASRGARFLDLVKQNKLNVSPQLNSKQQRRFSICDFMTESKKKEVHIDAADKKEYLTLSANVKHNPDASPSSGILSKKRKADTSEFSPLTSSVKRKRVGFRDPVSSTKEYLVTEEEEKLKSTSLIRCLTYNGCDDYEEDDLNKENEIKIKEETLDIMTEDETLGIKKEVENKVSIEESAMIDHDYLSDVSLSPQKNDVTTSDDSVAVTDRSGCADENKLTFKDKNELMEYITHNLSIDELLEKLTQAEEKSSKKKELVTKVVQTVGFKGLLNEVFPASDTVCLTAEQNSHITAMLNEISKLMEVNRSVKHKVFEMLSDKHSEELLAHSVQENSVSAICDQLTLPSVANYLIHKVNLSDTEDHAEMVSRMSSAMIRKLIANTQGAGKSMVARREESHELMKMLFKNAPKIEIFDTVHDFLRKLLEKL